jgi:HAD superfamily hydrolase (TIGR01509 family)
MALQAIFFDAGNTLVFPNLEITLAPLIARGVHPSQEQLYAAEKFAKTHLDSAIESSRSVDASYWQTYYGHLLNELKIEDFGLVRDLEKLARTSGNWNRVLPGTREVLEGLRKQFRLAVISNADGHIATLLKEVGIADCFDSIIDSGIVGHEKPHPAIFAAALNSMDAGARDSIYVGDIHSVDVLGARAVGMQAILMDVSGTYVGKTADRIDSLAQLDGKIATSAANASTGER